MDWDFDENEIDPEFTSELTRKLYKLMIDLNKTSIEHFNTFSLKELTAIKEFYGGSLVYSIYKDVDFVLREPKPSDTIH